MAGLFPHPLGCDSVDRLNHKWMVLLLLLLSLVAFIIPLHPNVRHESSEQPERSTRSQANVGEDSVTPGVVCWCPAQFEDNQVRYATNYCRNQLMSALAGNNDTTIYDVMDEIIPTEINKQKPLQFTPVKKYHENVQKMEENQTNKQEVTSDVWSLATYQVPIMLLVMAVVLVVPQVLWSIMSDLISPFSLGPSIESAREGGSHEDIYGALSQCFQSTTKTASVLYIVKKFLSVVAVIVCLVILTTHIMLEVRNLDERLDKATAAPRNTSGSQFPTEMPSSSSVQNLIKTFQPPNNVFLCEFKIRQLQMVHSFSIQCIVVTSHVAVASSSSRPKQSATFGSAEQQLLDFDSTIIHIAVSLLAVLGVANVISLVDWLSALCSYSTRNALRLPRIMAADLFLLVRLARINCGLNVAFTLARGSSSFENLDQGQMSEIKQ